MLFSVVVFSNKIVLELFEENISSDLESDILRQGSRICHQTFSFNPKMLLILFLECEKTLYPQE